MYGTLKSEFWYIFLSCNLEKKKIRTVLFKFPPNRMMQA